MSKFSQRKKTRRQFLVDSSKGACGVGFMGLGLAGYSNQSQSFNPQVLRPPGALAEGDFQSACVRCGLSVEA